jgi:SecD/SecF fusion protein
MAALTGSNLPDKDTDFHRRLGIVLDGQLLSAPRIMSQISDRGQITGRFSEEEIEFLVGILRSGKLPAALQPDPSSENRIGPTLGYDTIKKGSRAIGASLIVVLVFILLYYRFSGIVACLALLLNLTFTLAVIILIKAPLTLPGLAGLVLTVGMSVDANVLIFERIREEQAKGSKLRQAIRNGFARATTTIVDANLTTLITAIVLYAIGTDQIRGFAITLFVGILMSMYSDIYCARLLFDIFERKGWITELKLRNPLSGVEIDFLSKRTIALIGSVIFISIGLFGVYRLGDEILDIDFTGGGSVTFSTKDEPADAEVRSLVRDAMDSMDDGEHRNETLTVNRVEVEGRESGKVWKVDSSLANVDTLQKVIGSALDIDRYNVEAGQVVPIRDSADEAGTSDADAESTTGAEAEECFVQEEDSEPAEGEDESAVAPALRSSFMLTFNHAIPMETVREYIAEACTNNGYELDADSPRIVVAFAGDAAAADQQDKIWNVTIPVPPSTAEKVVSQISEEINDTPVWESASLIGGQVAGKTQQLAYAALGMSLLGIVAYIWIRFQRLVFGLAAVIALVHDVLVTLGAIAISHWLAGQLGFLLIEEFKISLPVVAAFLTIIGYSLNDTSVVFDRIREVRGKSPDLTTDMVNLSINQTLSRTLLTSATTLIVVLILYIWGGQGIHGFAFALLIGVVVGTYSSIFVASPALLWMIHLSRPQTSR